MHENLIKTRFAPSPTGGLHLGNLRTALFSALYAWHHGGVFLLRIEDTDVARSHPKFTRALMEDLRWLGLDWQEGPEAGGAAGPYLQSARGAVYARFYAQLIAADQAYPCFCTPEQLAAIRVAQRAASQPPRYAGTCAGIPPAKTLRRVAAGEPHTLRFRVPAREVIAFDDLVRGTQQFRSGDIGDFIIRRTEGTPAFFFCNAIDDALMGVNAVLRGEDHLSNTPRQLLLLRALGLPAPQYGHLPLIVTADGAPLAKRHGAQRLAQLREAGYLPAAINNYLSRLGHTLSAAGLLDLNDLTRLFRITRIGRSVSQDDPKQLDHWQKLALGTLDQAAFAHWATPALEGVPIEKRTAFLAAVHDNILLRCDLELWARVLFGEPLAYTGEAEAVMRAASWPLFIASLAATEVDGDDFRALAESVSQTTGVKGKALFMPLRAALTGQVHGPEMRRIFPLIDATHRKKRLEVALQMARPTAS